MCVYGQIHPRLRRKVVVSLASEMINEKEREKKKFSKKLKTLELKELHEDGN